MTPQVLYCYPEQAGKRWSPSNGTEGMIFIESFCDHCANEKWCHTQNDADKKCDILSRSMLEWPHGPEEWQYNEKGWPVCTEWRFWNWGTGDDGNENDPPEPPPYDPNQLCFPFIFDELGIFNPEIVNQ